MAENRHLELPARGGERRFQPLHLRGVDGLAHARVHDEKREAIRLELEERPLLESGRDPVFLSQPRRLPDERIDAAVGGPGEFEVGFDPRLHGGAGRVRFEERRRKRLQGVVPIVVAGNRIHRFLHPFEG